MAVNSSPRQNRRNARRIDPTANALRLVKDGRRADRELLSSELRRLDQLRTQSDRLTEKLDKERKDWARQASKAESQRLNALLAASKADAALALAKVEASTLASDKQIAVLTANQYTAGGGVTATDKAAAHGVVTRTEVIGYLVAAGTLLVALHAFKVF